VVFVAVDTELLCGACKARLRPGSDLRKYVSDRSTLKLTLG